MTQSIPLADRVIRDPAEREVESRRVIFAGKLEPAQFNSRGAALAYLDMLRRADRKPEAR